MISHLRLKTTKQLSEYVSLQADPNNFEFIVINHKGFDAVFSLHGAHLIHFQKKQDAALLYLSKNTEFSPDKAIRGGVPICWPWFGNTEESTKYNLPAHGFARINKWQVVNISESEHAVDIEFSFSSCASTQAIWDNQFKLTLKAHLSNQVDLTLITENTGDKSFSYGGALHSYLNIGSYDQCTVTGLADQYSDSLDDKKLKNAETILHIDKPIDSIYKVNKGEICVNDKKHHRQIKVVNEGNDSVVVWNPWIERSIAFVDLPDDGYKTMLCIESAITSKQGILVNPGQKHSLKTVIQ